VNGCMGAPKKRSGKTRKAPQTVVALQRVKGGAADEIGSRKGAGRRAHNG
jgi:hypothetical protein